MIAFPFPFLAGVRDSSSPFYNGIRYLNSLYPGHLHLWVLQSIQGGMNLDFPLSTCCGTSKGAPLSPLVVDRALSSLRHFPFHPFVLIQTFIGPLRAKEVFFPPSAGEKRLRVVLFFLLNFFSMSDSDLPSSPSEVVSIQTQSLAFPPFLSTPIFKVTLLSFFFPKKIRASCSLSSARSVLC